MRSDLLELSWKAAHGRYPSCGFIRSRPYVRSGGRVPNWATGNIIENNRFYANIVIVSLYEARLETEPNILHYPFFVNFVA